MWDVAGTYYGTLRQASQTSSTSWRFPLDDVKGSHKRDAIPGMLEEMEKEEAKKRWKKSLTIAAAEHAATIEARPITTSAPPSPFPIKNTLYYERDGEGSMSQPTSRPKRTSKFSPNIFLEQQKARIMWGDPELNKFNPLQPGQFPAIVKGLPPPLIRSSHAEVLMPTKPRSPLKGEERGNDFLEGLKVELSNWLSNITDAVKGSVNSTIECCQSPQQSNSIY